MVGNILGNIMSTLVLLSLAFAGGLVVGWNFLPQPEWVKAQIDKLKTKMSQ